MPECPCLGRVCSPWRVPLRRMVPVWWCVNGWCAPSLPRSFADLFRAIKVEDFSSYISKVRGRGDSTSPSTAREWGRRGLSTRVQQPDRGG